MFAAAARSATMMTAHHETQQPSMSFNAFASAGACWACRQTFTSTVQSAQPQNAVHTRESGKLPPKRWVNPHPMAITHPHTTCKYKVRRYQTCMRIHDAFMLADTTQQKTMYALNAQQRRNAPSRERQPALHPRLFHQPRHLSPGNSVCGIALRMLSMWVFVSSSLAAAPHARC